LHMFQTTRDLLSNFRTFLRLYPPKRADIEVLHGKSDGSRTVADEILSVKQIKLCRRIKIINL
jgi:hypothetical protein